MISQHVFDWTTTFFAKPGRITRKDSAAEPAQAQKQHTRHRSEEDPLWHSHTDFFDC